MESITDIVVAIKFQLEILKNKTTELAEAKINEELKEELLEKLLKHLQGIEKRIDININT